MKPETEIRNLKREAKDLRIRMDAAQRQADVYRIRATQAEQQAKEWERRFDVAIDKIPDVVV